MLTRIRTALKGWKTILANVLFAIVPILELTEVRDVIPVSWLPWYALGVTLANLWLRSVTSTPVGRKVPTQGQNGGSHGH